MRNKWVLVLVIVFLAAMAAAVLSASRWTSPGSGPSTPTGPVQIATDQNGATTAINAIKACGVTVIWDYLSQQVVFTNRNDGTAVVGYNDYQRFPGPWSEKLPGRGGKTAKSQHHYVGQIVEVRVNDGAKCDNTIKLELGR